MANAYRPQRHLEVPMRFSELPHGDVEGRRGGGAGVRRQQQGVGKALHRPQAGLVAELRNLPREVVLGVQRLEIHRAIGNRGPSGQRLLEFRLPPRECQDRLICWRSPTSGAGRGCRAFHIVARCLQMHGALASRSDAGEDRHVVIAGCAPRALAQELVLGVEAHLPLVDGREQRLRAEVGGADLLARGDVAQGAGDQGATAALGLAGGVGAAGVVHAAGEPEEREADKVTRPTAVRLGQLTPKAVEVDGKVRPQE
eukprot:CAMPEP_0175582542 /NCGR_PEP_ID=MMETSP0096-20121207/48192_1 /TAXON_ID=311494 /ORGANISM="Alexandrium monilatum, Strain CCMP3105" /LENGTH=255 /DNA_ID=CAMNT_0016886221 /DNA_START=204 /DNA_END=971 /DNA_ORIENTATION=+